MGKNTKTKRQYYIEGFRDGFPIGLGYLAVGFSIGLAGREVNLTVLQGFLISLLNNASAGEYAGITMIAAHATLVETAIMIFIANARYLLMSCALSQHLSPSTSLMHRMIMAFDVTDEIFGVSIAQKGYLSPVYFYGAMTLPLICWSSGTGLGVLVGNLLPARLSSAFCVALFGMFIAIIIPPAKQNKVILGCVIASFTFSLLFTIMPVVSTISAGTRTIILTVAISAVAAILFPHEEDDLENE